MLFRSAQYGRGAGIVKGVAEQLTAQFAQNLSAAIAAGRGAAAEAPAPQRAEAVSAFALLLATLKAMFRRWFGTRP